MERLQQQAQQLAANRHALAQSREQLQAALQQLHGGALRSLDNRYLTRLSRSPQISSLIKFYSVNCSGASAEWQHDAT